MLKFDLVNFETIAIIASAALCVTVLILLCLLYGFSRRREIKFDEQIKDASRSIRIYRIDMKTVNISTSENSVYSKDKFKLTKAKYEGGRREAYSKFVSFEKFLKHYAEQAQLSEWLQNLLDEKSDAPKFLELKIVPESNKYRISPKKNLHALLEVEKVNYETQQIYIVSHILRSESPKKSKFKDKYVDFETQENFNKLVRSQTTAKGVTVAFNFFNKRAEYDPLPRLTFLQLKKIFLKYHNVNRSVIAPSGERKIVFSDFKISNKADLMSLLNSIKNEISSYLLISSQIDNVGYTIGVVDNKYFVTEPDKLVMTACELAEFAKNDQTTLVWYEPEKDYDAPQQEDTYRSEVERLIRDKRLKYYFRPIVNIKANGRILGYQAFAEPIGDFFKSIEDLKRYAFRINEDKELFATITRNTIPSFNQQVGDSTYRLFYSIRFNEKDYVNRTLAYISNIKDCHIVLVYNEQDLLDLPSNSEDSVVRNIQTMKAKGYQVALELNDNDLTLSDAIYASFDYYMLDVNNNLEVDSKISKKNLFAFRGLIESLLKYEKTIIAIGVPTWDSIDLIYGLGIDYIGSEVISPKDENVLPLTPKTVTKIKQLKE